MDVSHPDDAAKDQPAEQPPQPTTVPAKEASAPEAPAPKAAAPETPPADSLSYWQVLAGSQAVSRGDVAVAQRAGLPRHYTAQPQQSHLGVGGPYSDKQSLGKAKKQLQDAGSPTSLKSRERYADTVGRSSQTAFAGVGPARAAPIFSRSISSRADCAS